MVSVIVPNYNHARFLGKRLNSILEQSYPDFEVIILDDGSNDESRALIESYRAHPKVSRIVFNEKNSGSVFSQWQKGIGLASGELIWIAESDDWCEPSLLQSLVPAFEVNKDCVLAYCQSYCMLGENEILWQSTESSLEQVLPGTEFVARKMVSTNSLFNASMAVFRKGAFDQTGEEFTTFNFCGDWLFWIEIALQGNVFISGKTLNYFRRDHGNHSTKSRDGRKSLEELRLFKSLYERGMMTRSMYASSLRNSYIRFLDVRKQLDVQTSRAIKGQFNQASAGIINLQLVPLTERLARLKQQLQ